MIQPDLATAGGILENHKTGGMAQEYGVSMVQHMAGSPVSCFALELIRFSPDPCADCG